ncbi:MAG: [LysW]-aminoadipate kinase [Planctomycetota bacterium]
MLVLKIGGAAGVESRTVLDDLARLVSHGRQAVLVHGGSHAANQLGEALGHPPRFVTSVSGHTSRLTDERTLEIFLMATALVNRRLVAGLQARGVNAVGLSGIDGALLPTQRKEVLRIVENGRSRIVRDDRTGRPTGANAMLLRTLLGAGYLPVIAPVGLSSRGEPLNVDGDRAAAAVAGALGATTLVLLTAVPGVLRAFPDEASLIRHVPVEGLHELAELAGGRMKKKVLGAREALRAGVRRVVIAGTTGETPLRDALAGRGTVIGAPPDATAPPEPMAPLRS